MEEENITEKQTNLGKLLSKNKFFCFLSSSESGQKDLLDTIQVDVYTVKGPQSYRVLWKRAPVQEIFVKWFGNINSQKHSKIHEWELKILEIVNGEFKIWKSAAKG